MLQCLMLTAFVCLAFTCSDCFENRLTHIQRKFCVINCETISWKPISFSDMFSSLMMREGDIWTVCNIANSELLPSDIYEYSGIIITGSHFDCRSERTSYFDWVNKLIHFWKLFWLQSCCTSLWRSCVSKC